MRLVLGVDDERRAQAVHVPAHKNDVRQEGQTRWYQLNSLITVVGVPPIRSRLRTERNLISENLAGRDPALRDAGRAVPVHRAVEKHALYVEGESAGQKFSAEAREPRSTQAPKLASAGAYSHGGAPRRSTDLRDRS